MRFGVCTSIDNIDMISALGFDYLEANATALAGLSDDEFVAACAKVEMASIKVEALNILFPKTFSLYETPTDELEAHLEKAFFRAEKLGAKVAVFGSGKSRMKPVCIQFGTAYQKIVEALRLAGDVAARHGISIVVEPLNYSETNMINSIAEGAILSCDADRKNVLLLADSYHMFRESENMDNIRTAGLLGHTHIALLEGRAYPTESNELTEGFFAALRDIGYNDRMSIEGSTKDIETDARKALAVLRKLEANS